MPDCDYSQKKITAKVEKKNKKIKVFDEYPETNFSKIDIKKLRKIKIRNCFNNRDSCRQF
ncbi:hypothetical protein BpHYR1_004141 [Brachionus plicatilis]|uniref:Uncharacterized protein n=1 Tax=Brachionus plicatilis TaxID=10195 RepID=A0A3M7QH66_BRAPC|nr:hypothetical protein BpHYR1_004141 [Brachionus plicatilis]